MQLPEPVKISWTIGFVKTQNGKVQNHSKMFEQKIVHLAQVQEACYLITTQR